MMVKSWKYCRIQVFVVEIAFAPVFKKIKKGPHIPSSFLAWKIIQNVGKSGIVTFYVKH